MNLYDLTLAAESEVSTYRSADIGEWRAAIDPVLKAAGEGFVGNDMVNDITVDADELRICTAYTVRGCAQFNSMCIPLSILKSENAVQAATRYRLGKELAEAKTRLATTQRAVTDYTEKVASLEAELAAT